MRFTTLIVSLALVGCTDLGQAPEWQETQNVILVSQSSFQPDQWPTGDYNIESAVLEGDLLKLKVTLPGNPPTRFRLVAWNYLETAPVQVYALLSFEARPAVDKRSACDLAFDLTPLKTWWQIGYQHPSGVIVFGIWYQESRPRLAVRYTF